MKRNNYLSKLILALIALITIYFNFSKIPHNILSWDVFGYYLYLPFTFIYGDLGLNDVAIVHEIIDKYQNTATFYQAMKLPEGNWVMKYSMGMAILYLPFFLVGHLVATLSSFPSDGFSMPYQISILVGGLLYTIAGIYFIRKLLLKFFSDRITSLVLLLVFFGTNYFFHSSFGGQNAMSHNYLFTLYGAILLLTINWHTSQKLRDMILLALVCGVTILSRPTEIVCLLIPLLWGVWDKNSLVDKINLMFKHKIQIIIFSAILILIGSLQFIYWKIYTGKFLFYSYGGNAGEGFEFFRPYIRQVLFSFRKGWLIYTPMMVFSIIGLVFLYKKNKSIFFPILLYFIINLYFVSSWSCWWYAESFSQRSLIQSYAVLALPFGYFIQYIFSIKRIWQSVVGAIILALVVLNLFQTWQIEKGIIHGSRMTKEYYFSIFGKKSVDDDKKDLLLISRSFDGKEKFSDEENYNKMVLDIKDFESEQSDKMDTTFVYSGLQSFRLDAENIFSPAIEAPYSNLTKNYYAWVRVSVMVYPVTDIKLNPSSLVASFEHNGYAYKYRALDLDKLELELNSWNKVTFDYLTPEIRNKKDKLKVYVWHRGQEKVFIDDLKVDVFEPK